MFANSAIVFLLCRDNEHWSCDMVQVTKILVLDVCSAAGVVMDSLIIYKANNMWTSWYGDKALPNTYYGKSENGTSI